MRPHGRASVNSGSPIAFAQCCLVYLVRNKINNKCYVGSTKRGLVDRRKRHLIAARKGSVGRLHKAIRKYGSDAFEWTILEQVERLDQLNDCERFWIQKIKPEYNVDLMVAGWRRSERALHKLSIASRRWALGHPDHWEKYRRLGPESSRRPFKHVITGAIYGSRTEAAKKLGVSPNRIMRILQGIHSDFTLLQFKYLTEEECERHRFKYNPPVVWSEERKKRFKKKKHYQCKPVICLDDDMWFDSVEGASNYYQFNASRSQCSNAHPAIHRGYKWFGKMFAYADKERVE